MESANYSQSTQKQQQNIHEYIFIKYIDGGCSRSVVTNSRWPKDVLQSNMFTTVVITHVSDTYLPVEVGEFEVEEAAGEAAEA